MKFREMTRIMRGSVVANNLPVDFPSFFADVGTDDGVVARQIEEKRNARIVGFDIPTMADFYRGRWPGVTLIDVMHHVQRCERITLLQSCQKSARYIWIWDSLPGIAQTVTDAGQWHDNPTRKEWLEFITPLGFVEHEVKCPWWYPVKPISFTWKAA